MNVSSPIRILLVDDHTLFRESLRRLLEEDTDYIVVAETATVAGALKLCSGPASFDLALIDYDLGPAAGAKNGVSVLRCLRKQKEFIPALMIAAQIDPNDLLTVVRDLHTGIFLKADPPEELLPALDKAMRRKVWISTGLDLNLIKETSAEQQIASDSTITFGPEESAVFSLVVEGLSNKEIGARLNLPESAVKNTLQRL